MALLLFRFLALAYGHQAGGHNQYRSHKRDNLGQEQPVFVHKFQNSDSSFLLMCRLNRID